MIPRIEYLRWIEGRPEAAAHDLGSSDLRGSGPLQTGVVPDRLADAPAPPAGTDLAAQVAAVYGVDPGNVLLTAGASLANVCAVGAALSLAGETDGPPAATTDAGSGGTAPADAERPTTRVLVEKPGYEPLVATPRALGARADRFLRRAGENYRLDPDRVEGAVTDATALVAVTNRHNPSGRLADRETLAATGAAAREAGARLLVDEVYAPYVTDPPENDDDAGDSTGSAARDVDTGGTEASDADAPTAFGGPTAAGIEDAVVTGSLTKFHGLGGLRVGWLVADREFVEAARAVADHVPAFAAPSAALGRRALADRDRIGREAREHLRANAALLERFVDGREDLAGPVFEGASFAFLDHADADGDAVVEAAERRDLLVVPGRFFGDADRFRVSLGRDPGSCEAALDVLGETLDAL